MKKQITLLGLLFVGLVQGQTVEWSNSTGGASFDFATATRINSTGSIFSGGNFLNSADFDPNGGTVTLVTGGASNNGFVQALDFDGNFMWAGALLTTQYSTVEDIEIDANDNIYICGAFSGSTNFGMLGAPNNVSSLTASGGTYNTNGYIAKYSSNGILQWVYTLGDASLEQSSVLKIALSDDGTKIYSAGNFRGTMDTDPLTGAGIISSGSNTTSAAFLFELSSSGTYAISYEYRNAFTGDIQVDNSGNILFSGTSSGITDFDLNAGFTNNVAPVNNVFAFLTKIEPDYDPLWVYEINNMGNSSAINDIVTDANNMCYLSGEFSDIHDFDNTATSNVIDGANGTPFLMKLNSAGDYQWVLNDLGATDLFVDENDDLYHCGSFLGTVDFDPSPSVTENHSESLPGSQDSYIRKLDAMGNLLWYDIFEIANGLGGGPSAPFSNLFSITKKDDNLVAMGFFNQELYVESTPLVSQGEPDFFIAKYTIPCFSSNTVTQNGLTLTTDAPGAISYQWIDCNNSNQEINGETGASLTATSNGSYAVVVDNGNCTDTSACFVINDASIDELNTSFQMYPNPTTGQFTVQSNSIIEMIVIRNNLGQIVNTTFNKNQIDISNLNNGVYFVSITSEGKIRTRKLIKK